MNDSVPRIMVVDDEVGMREGCSKILTSEGYNVDTAADGYAALEVMQKRDDVAVALVDLKMPRMSGLDLIRHLRERDEDLIILIITAYATIDTAVEATRRGAYGYIPKPFTPDELLLPVRNGLQHRALNMEAKRLRQERERRMLEIAAERTKCNTIIRCMTDGVLVVNGDRQIVLTNTAAGRMLPGLEDLEFSSSLDRLECQELQELVDEALRPKLESVIASREIKIAECVYMANVSPVLEPSREVTGAVVVLRDITALKKIETAKSMFISMVAHEIKSPLAAIEGQLGAVLGGMCGTDRDQEHATLERSLLRARALRALINDLLNLTAMDTGNFTIRRSRLDLRPIVESAVDALRERAEEKEITLTLDYEKETVWAVMADKDSVEMIITNLLDNAIKYTPKRGHVRINVANTRSHVKITVQDDGIGMSPEEQQHVFEEFYRAKNELAIHVTGTGLGLTLVKRLVEMHDGKIVVASEPGKGSTFAVSLPAAV